MISLQADEVVALPVDQLGMLVLADLIATREWNEYNHLNQASLTYSGPALDAVAEATGWLRARGLIARKAGQTADAAIFVTRAGHAALKDGLGALYARERLQGGLHPLIEAKGTPSIPSR